MAQKRGKDPPERTPPYSEEAEQSVLGAAMLTRDALEVLATRLRPDDFYKPAHGHIAAVLISAFEGNWAADPVTVADELNRRGLMDAVGGIPTLVTLQAGAPGFGKASAERYASIVHDHATMRRLIAAANEISTAGYELPENVHDAVVRAQQLLADVAANNGKRAYSTLQFADVAALVSGEIPMIEADFLTRSDGRSLFYAGRMHVLQGEPSGGKSFIAVQAAIEVLALGGSVLYLDYEDSPEGIVGRVLACGGEPGAVAERFCYVRPEGPFGAAERTAVETRLGSLNPDMVVIDGVAESIARDGLNEDKAGEVVQWVERLPRFFARTGAAVVMVDHVTKNTETRGRYARGSSAKLAAIDGAAYFVSVKAPFSRHQSGLLRLSIDKDRPGGVGPIKSTAAEVHIEPHADGERVVIRLEPPSAGTAADSWKPTVLMAKVSRELEQAVTPMTVTTVKGLLASSKPKLVQEAITRLVAEGNVRSYKQGSATYLKLVTAYGVTGDEFERYEELEQEELEF